MSVEQLSSARSMVWQANNIDDQGLAAVRLILHTSVCCSKRSSFPADFMSRLAPSPGLGIPSAIVLQRNAEASDRHLLPKQCFATSHWIVAETVARKAFPKSTSDRDSGAIADQSRSSQPKAVNPIPPSILIQGKDFGCDTLLGWLVSTLATLLARLFWHCPSTDTGVR